MLLYPEQAIHQQSDIFGRRRAATVRLSQEGQVRWEDRYMAYRRDHASEAFFSEPPSWNFGHTERHYDA